MGVARHLGIRLRDYDARIRTFIPRYDEMLETAASALTALEGPASLVVDLGVGTGALAKRVSAAARRARIIGIDTDDGMLALARKRLGAQLTTMSGDFLTVALPPCDVITASFALHHIRTRRQKARMYARCFTALRRGGVLVSADCCLADNPRLRGADRAAWLAHLRRRYARARAEQLLRTWAKEDVYFRLKDEVQLLRTAGFAVDVPWRHDGFAVIVGVKKAVSGRR
jgi:ubiquinone/menaquinone biosynthesis C-methylase UbiE